MEFSIAEIKSEEELDYFIQQEFEAALENNMLDSTKPKKDLFESHKNEMISFIQNKARESKRHTLVL